MDMCAQGKKRVIKWTKNGSLCWKHNALGRTQLHLNYYMIHEIYWYNLPQKSVGNFLSNSDAHPHPEVA